MLLTGGIFQGFENILKKMGWGYIDLNVLYCFQVKYYDSKLYKSDFTLGFKGANRHHGGCYIGIASEIFKSFLTDSNRENVCTLVQTFCA